MTHQELAIQFFENFVYEGDDHSAQSIADFLKGRKNDVVDRDTFIEQLATVIIAKHSGESYIDHARCNNIKLEAQALLNAFETPPVTEDIAKCASDIAKEGERVAHRFNCMLRDYEYWCGDKIFTLLERENGNLDRLMEELCHDAEDVFLRDFNLGISSRCDDDICFEIMNYIKGRIENAITTPLRLDSDGKVFKVKQ